MATGEEGGEAVPGKREIPHYHGHETRVFFLIMALVLIVAQSTGADLPLSTFGTVLMAVVLVIAAGVTNPRQRTIHWWNEAIAVVSTIIFGTAAVSRYRLGVNLFDPSFIYVEALALLSLFALYFTTRTLRALHLR